MVVEDDVFALPQPKMGLSRTGRSVAGIASLM
jgi:hypothetical protein